MIRDVRRLGAGVACWCGWWLGCFWLWMLLVGEWNRVEWVAAACAAAVAATIAERGRRAARVEHRLPLERLRASASVPLFVFVDFGVVVYALLRSVATRRVVRGCYLGRPFDAGPKTTAAGAAHRAWTTVLAGYGPNAYVVDVDPERDLVLVHDLVPWRRSEEPA